MESEPSIGLSQGQGILCMCYLGLENFYSLTIHRELTGCFKTVGGYDPQAPAVKAEDLGNTAKVATYHTSTAEFFKSML